MRIFSLRGVQVLEFGDGIMEVMWRRLLDQFPVSAVSAVCLRGPFIETRVVTGHRHGADKRPELSEELIRDKAVSAVVLKERWTAASRGE